SETSSTARMRSAPRPPSKLLATCAKAIMGWVGMWSRTRSRSSYPPLEGEGRLTLSEAKCETGWGDSLNWGTALGERLSPHPAAHCIRVDPPPQGEGKWSAFAKSEQASV